jgi:hypothetical protein
MASWGRLVSTINLAEHRPQKGRQRIEPDGAAQLIDRRVAASERRQAVYRVQELALGAAPVPHREIFTIVG